MYYVLYRKVDEEGKWEMRRGSYLIQDEDCASLLGRAHLTGYQAYMWPSTMTMSAVALRGSGFFSALALCTSQVFE